MHPWTPASNLRDTSHAICAMSFIDNPQINCIDAPTEWYALQKAQGYLHAATDCSGLSLQGWIPAKSGANLKQGDVAHIQTRVDLWIVKFS